MTPALPADIAALPAELAVVIAGPTASGKSALALRIAEAQGRAVVNADALQVFRGWPILTAQPAPADRDRAAHLLYGHLPHDAAYSVGAWLREAAPLLGHHPAPVIVGGTGLYLTALTEGLAEIPATDAQVRARATRRLDTAGLEALVAELDPPTRARLDTRNPMRVQRAWEVLHQTGRGLADWQGETGPALLPEGRARLLQIMAAPDVLTPRIAARFHAMLHNGAMDEARAMLPHWNPAHQSARAIGAEALISVLQGRMRESDAVRLACIATRQYAKRQRSWFRRRMGRWQTLDASELCGDFVQHTRKRP